MLAGQAGDRDAAMLRRSAIASSSHQPGDVRPGALRAAGRALTIPGRIRRRISESENPSGRCAHGTGSSHSAAPGGFGDTLPGPVARLRPRAVAVWRVINSIFVRQKSSGLGEWYDIHATT
jgi:hypothetical protein